MQPESPFLLMPQIGIICKKHKCIKIEIYIYTKNKNKI